jgi:hypothetical protein
MEIGIKMTREEIMTVLKENVAQVTFTKVNGDVRIMDCTLNESHLPQVKEDDQVGEKKVREINEEVVSVWDTKAQGWRSFRVESVSDVEIIESF